VSSGISNGNSLLQCLLQGERIRSRKDLRARSHC